QPQPTIRIIAILRSPPCRRSVRHMTLAQPPCQDHPRRETKTGPPDPCKPDQATHKHSRLSREGRGLRLFQESRVLYYVVCGMEYCSSRTDSFLQDLVRCRREVSCCRC